MGFVHGRVLGVCAAALFALTSWLAPTRVQAQAKCCECGPVLGDETQDVVCFNDPLNNSSGDTGCPTACAACGLVVAQFNANQTCSEDPTGPAGVGRCPVIYDNPSQGCGDVEPPGCENDSDCADPGVCLKAVCDAGDCVIQADDTESCSDGDPCTTNDRCSGGSCVGTPVAGCVPREAPTASNWGIGILVIALFIPGVLILRRRGRRA